MSGKNCPAAILMPSELTSLDIKILVSELQPILAGARMQKFYQLDKETHILLHIPQKGTNTLVIGAGKLFLTKRRFEYPPAPSNFAMTLRKYVAGRLITAIEQHDFDRVVIIRTETHKIIAELFRNGNISLTDSESKIWSMLERQEWKDRAIKLREEYRFPAKAQADISKIGESDKQSVVFLASDMSFGGEYAEEILSRAKIEKSKPCKALSGKEISAISKEMKKILSEEPAPCVVRDASGNAADFAPFPLARHKGANIEKKETFNEAVAEFFSQPMQAKKEAANSKAEKSREGKLALRLSQQTGAVASIEAEAERAKKIGDAIYADYGFFERAISEKENHAINMKDKTITVAHQGEKITLHYEQPLSKSAEAYYLRAKQLKAKLARLNAEIERTRKVIEESKSQEEERQAAAHAKPQKKREWYHDFRWFFTSGGFLCVCGRDAESNEELVKRRVEKTDLVLHADITGSPFGLLKTRGKAVDDKSIKEALEFVASYSRAWQAGVGVVDAYWVLPEQVTKQAPAGEYISKGSFMIYGKKNSQKTELRLAIGVKDGEAVCGAVSSIPEPFAIIKPGRIGAKELSEAVKKQIISRSQRGVKDKAEKIRADEIQRHIPFGSGALMK